MPACVRVEALGDREIFPHEQVTGLKGKADQASCCGIRKGGRGGEGWGFLSRPTFMGAFRERSILKYEECHEDGCEIFRNGFHSTQVRQGLWFTINNNNNNNIFSVESLASRLGMVVVGGMVWENSQQFLYFFWCAGGRLGGGRKWRERG